MQKYKFYLNYLFKHLFKLSAKCKIYSTNFIDFIEYYFKHGFTNVICCSQSYRALKTTQQFT
jgi:hypothetical protein